MSIPTVFQAALLAIAAMLSLLIGTFISLVSGISHRTNAVIMAFGTGALIQALALELAYEGAERLIHHAHMTGVESWFWVAGGFAAGGSLYYFANRFLEERGAALRHPALSKLYALNKKRETSAALLNRLSSIDLVRSLPPEDMEEVLLCVEPRSVKAGELIFRQGEKGDALYFVDDGRVDICTNDDSKERRVLAQLKAGDSFGEMALVTGEPRTASAVAVEDSSLLRIDKVHFDELIDRSTSLRKAVERLSSERLLQNVESAGEGRELQRWKEVALANIRNLSRSEELEMLKKHASASAPFAIFMGAMLDGIPESIVIGSSFTSLDSFRFTFLAAVFLSNLPEAIASASAMKQAGFARWKIVGLWGFLVVAGGIAAALGNAYLAHAPVQALTLVGAVAGGGILAMVSSVMMPEAYEDGGPTVGLATIAGFLCAFFFSFV